MTLEVEYLMTASQDHKILSDDDLALEIFRGWSTPRIIADAVNGWRQM